MTHKLLITLKTIGPKQYKKYVSKNETITGKTTRFRVTLKNVGDKSIPEGKVEVNMERPVGGVTTFSISVMPIKTPAIKPDETYVFGGKEDMVIPGVWFITVKATFKDKEKVEYYKSETVEPESGAWIEPLYVIDRHDLDRNILLEKLLDKIEG